MLLIPRPLQISSTTIFRCIRKLYGALFRNPRTMEEKIKTGSRLRASITHAGIMALPLTLIFISLSLSSVQNGQPTVPLAASLFQELCYQNKDQLSAGIIVGGWDKENGGTVWNIPLGGSLHRQPFAIGGSGSTYIFGYCDSTYRDGMSKEECMDFVKNCMLSFSFLFCPLLRSFFSSDG